MILLGEFPLAYSKDSKLPLPEPWKILSKGDFSKLPLRASGLGLHPVQLSDLFNYDQSYRVLRMGLTRLVDWL